MSDSNQMLPWKKAVKRITRKSTETNATGAFRCMLAEQVRKVRQARNRRADDETVARIVSENIERFRETGMSLKQVEGYREIYQEMPRRGLRPRKNSLTVLNSVKTG